MRRGIAKEIPGMKWSVQSSDMNITEKIQRTIKMKLQREIDVYKMYVVVTERVSAMEPSITALCAFNSCTVGQDFWRENS